MNRVFFKRKFLQIFFLLGFSPAFYPSLSKADKEDEFQTQLLFRYPIKSVNGPKYLDAIDLAEGVGLTPLMPSEAFMPNAESAYHASNLSINQASGMGLARERRGNYWLKGWPSGTTLDPNYYIEFRFAPHCGYEVSFESLSFTLYSTVGTMDFIIGPRYWELHASIEEPTNKSHIALGLINKIGQSLSSWFREENSEKTTILYRHDMGNVGRSNASIHIPLKDVRILKAIRSGATIIFRLYGYQAKDGKGGLYHLNEVGGDLEAYGSVIHVTSCSVLSPPVFTSSGKHEVVLYTTDGTWGHEEGGKGFASASTVAKLRHIYKGKDAGKVVYFRGPSNEKDTASSLGQYAGAVVGSGAMNIAEKLYSLVVENYNQGYTKMIFVGWSRGAAITMQAVSYIYHRGIPNTGRKGGYYILPHSDCIAIDQVHLLDMVHSMVVPGNDVNHGWYDRVLPPNIKRAWHYLADVKDPPPGFKQTRPLNAIELPMCLEMGIIPSHGDVGGSTASACSGRVMNVLIDNMNSLGEAYIITKDTPIEWINPNPVPVQIYSSEGFLVDEEVVWE